MSEYKFPDEIDDTKPVEIDIDDEVEIEIVDDTPESA